MLLILCTLFTLASHAWEVCMHTEGGYHLVLTPSSIDPLIARPLCQSLGFDYAIVKPQTYKAAANVIGNCTSDSVGIWSYDGYSFRHHQFMQSSGSFGMCLSNCDYPNELPILCYDFKSRIAENYVHDHFKSDRIKQDDSLPQICKASLNGYHLITGNFEVQSAHSECQKNEWSLANISSDEMDVIKAIWDACEPIDAVAWIDGVDGVKGGKCRSIYRQGNDTIWMVVSEEDHPCTLGGAMILCSENNNSVHRPIRYIDYVNIFDNNVANLK